jgi:hypothetical protein
MKFNFEISKLALKDLNNIWEYSTDQWSKQQANRYYKEIIEILIRDVLGKELHKQIVSKENNVVDVSGIPSGLLIFSIQNGYKVKVLKA